MLASRTVRNCVKQGISQARSISSGENSISSFLSTATVQRQNGEKERRLFTDKEYGRRLADLRFVNMSVLVRI